MVEEGRGKSKSKITEAARSAEFRSKARYTPTEEGESYFDLPSHGASRLGDLRFTAHCAKQMRVFQNTTPLFASIHYESVSKYPFTHKQKVPILCFQALLLHGNFVSL